MDFLSGDLDRVFTVLYEMGKVEELLNEDWKRLYRKSLTLWPEISKAIQALNSLNSIKDIRKYLESLPSEVVDALVIEVAREMADFQDSEKILH